MRVAAEPISEFKQLELTQTFNSVKNLRELEIKTDELKIDICDQLYIFAKACEDDKSRTLIINNKRKIFNRKRVSFGDIELPTELKENIFLFDKSLEKLDNERALIKEKYIAEVEESQKKLKILSSGKSLWNGLVLSSQTLLKEIIKDLDPQAKQSKRWEEVEDGVIKYLSRIYCKTSPFSTFTNLAIAKISDQKLDGILLVNSNSTSPKSTQSHIRINNSILDWSLSIIKRYQPIKCQLTLRLNPTVNHVDGNYKFLINKGNVETFQTLKKNEALEALEFIFNLYGTSGLSWEELSLLLKNNYIDTELDIINEYINSLIGIGFLEYNIGVSGLSDLWDHKLIQKLKNLRQTPIGDKIVYTLVEVRNIAKNYELAQPLDRLMLMDAAYQLLVSLATFTQNCIHDNSESDPAALKVNIVFPYKAEQIFFEDTTLNLDLSISQSIIEHLNICFDLAESQTIFDGNFDEREKMLTYFIDKFPDSEVDILQFYEVYYRDVKVPKSQLDNNRPIKDAPLDEEIDGLKQRNEKFRTWCEAFHRQIVNRINNEVVKIKHDQIESTNKELDFEPILRKRSFGFIAQSFQENGIEYFVLTGISAGYGKWFSRFLHLFSADITKALRNLNSQFNEKALLLENCDASFFNANMHPPLLPLEILVPNANYSLNAEAQIPITDLKIWLNKEKQRLELVHIPSKKQVHVVDFGFLSLKRRSELFQLLENFTFIENVAFFSVLNSVNAVASAQNRREGLDFDCHPRIVLNEKVILQRKTWIFDKSKLPLRNPSEASWEYFCRINLWRLKHSIPDEVFIYVHERESQVRSKYISRDDYKPQYISFSNAHLVNLLGRLMKKVPVRLKVVEMLPNSNQLLSIGKDKYVMEFIFQSYNY
ncbi:Lantibiotic dehydratase, C terminus [Dyadobacter koreensis]|uniref:Lantibiotic dehydratase, C terminus n=2 Tax=Dyadobacter koreensis TaxID=408657 RepID=A0A1H7AWL9_9BACT|nr:Lantibiotic dehydratase, C terminus [Dyadobacter koreensis]